jgi:Zn-finger nucleic acid-binding protein
MSERQGIEIDYCPQCRGIWLDRGELDKIIERAGREAASEPLSSSYSRPQSGRGYDDDYDRSRDRRYPKRKKSFLQELFD